MPEAYSSPSNDAIRRNDGDLTHGISLVSLSEDEGTQFHKKRRYEYPFRRHITDRNDKPVVTTQIKDKIGETSSGYFLHNIRPNRISLPSDSSG